MNIHVEYGCTSDGRFYVARITREEPPTYEDIRNHVEPARTIELYAPDGTLRSTVQIPKRQQPWEDVCRAQ